MNEAKEVQPVTKVQETAIIPTRRRLSRRGFLRLAGGVAVEILLSGCLGLATPLESTDSSGTIFSESDDKEVKRHMDNLCFRESSVKRMIREQKLDPKIYGILAASAASIICPITEGNRITYNFGSGGVAEYKGHFYLVTATHVIQRWLLNPKSDEIHFSIPGLDKIYKGRPRELYMFNSVTIDKDEPTFIRLSGDVVKKIKEQQLVGNLISLQPSTYWGDRDKNSHFFRYQGDNPRLLDITTQREDLTTNVRRFYGVVTSGENSVCGGVSGTPILRSEEGDITNKFIGVLTHSVGDDKEDTLGVLGQQCKVGLNYGSFNEKAFPAGMVKRKTLVE